MRLLVLGKHGQVGWELQRALAPLGEIISLSRLEADLATPGMAAAAVAELAPDVVVNAAAYTAVDTAEADPEQAARVNSGAVGELARQAKAGYFLLVHYSSDYVFNGRKAGLYVEDDETDPLGIYGLTKRDGEDAVRQSGCRHLIFHTSWVHAARGRNFVRRILQLAAERQVLSIVSDQVGAPTSAELIADVTAHAIRQTMATELSRNSLNGTYHLSSLGEASWFELAQFIVGEAVARGAALRLVPDAITPIPSYAYPTAAVRPANSRLDTRKLRESFGLSLPAWQSGVTRTVNEILERGDHA